jgi:hypothetical protein
MSEAGDNDYDLHFDAANELSDPLRRAERILARIARDFAATDRNRPSHLRDLVTRSDVLRAAEILFGPSASPGAQWPQRGGFVFISYSSSDSDFAEELSQALQAAAISSFMANRSIRTASVWVEEIWRALRTCRVLLAVLTPSALESQWCLAEAGAAIALKKVIVPVLRHVRQSDIPSPLKQFQAMKVETSLEQQRLVQFLTDYRWQ